MHSNETTPSKSRNSSPDKLLLSSRKCQQLSDFVFVGSPSGVQDLATPPVLVTVENVVLSSSEFVPTSNSISLKAIEDCSWSASKSSDTNVSSTIKVPLLSCPEGQDPQSFVFEGLDEKESLARNKIESIIDQFKEVLSDCMSDFCAVDRNYYSSMVIPSSPDSKSVVSESPRPPSKEIVSKVNPVVKHPSEEGELRVLGKFVESSPDSKNFIL